MALALEHMESCPEDEWLYFWNNCRWATFFESPFWINLWCQTAGNHYRPHVLRLQFNDGLRMVIPGTRGSRLRSLLSVCEFAPAGTYGGPLSTDRPLFEHIYKAADILRKKYPDFYFRINPYLLAETGLRWPGTTDYTHSFELQIGDRELEKRFRKKRVASYAQKASSKGYRITLGEPEHLQDFMSIYQKNQMRWKQPARIYTRDFLQGLIAEEHVDFWICLDQDGRLAGGGIIALGQTTAVSWLPVMDSPHMRNHANELLFTDLIRYYRSRGCEWFDFNPSGGNPGVAKFKEKFQPALLPAPVIHRKSWMLRMVDFMQTGRKTHG